MSTWFRQLPPLLPIGPADARTGWVGVDEVGRGALWGPVVTCAVYWPVDWVDADPDLITARRCLQDSKRLTPRQRQAAVTWLQAPAQVAGGLRWAIVEAPPQDVDTCGIRAVTERALWQAVERVLGPDPGVTVVIDGDAFPVPARDPPVHFAPRADATWACVAAASILAKEHRDAEVRAACTQDLELDTRYALARNVGYGTAAHQAGLLRFGPHVHHRHTFLRKLLGDDPAFV